MAELLIHGEIAAEVKYTPVKKSKRKNVVDIFAETRGMWADRKIDAHKLRSDAWNIKS
jgi:hypothetical protein